MEKQHRLIKKSRGFLGEFKEFISRGSVVDLAVGVIMGSTFTAIVTSLVNDILMPAIGAIFGGLNFTDLKIVLSPAQGTVAEAAIYYGNFLQALVNFLLVAFALFLMVRQINRFHKKKEAAPPAPAEPSEEVLLLREIRDLLQDSDASSSDKPE